MTNEEAKIIIQEMPKLIWDLMTFKQEEAVTLAIKSLEKQTPKAPFIWEEKYYFSPTPNDDWGYECPCCGNRDIDYPDHHCTCGQALDWEEL